MTIPSHTIRPIAYYTSAHGYGHGVRTCDILLALSRLYPDVPVNLTTGLPEEFLKNRLGGAPVTIRRGAFDVGMVQLDSVRVDVDATLERVRAVYDRREELIDQESEFLRSTEAAVVVADVPAIPIEAAKRAGIPAVAVANFAWDWIYSEFQNTDDRWKSIIQQFAEGYSKADLLLRLPFAEELKAFPRHENMPLVASPGNNRRDELVRLSGADGKNPLVLVSFTDLEWDGDALDAVEALDGYEFLTVKPLEWSRRNIHSVDRNEMPFSDVLASCDLVISKPGFGLVSECIVNDKPLVYVDRTEFLEYPILVAGIERYLRHVHIPQSHLYAGDLGPFLERVQKSTAPPDTMPTGGAEIAAKRIMDVYDQ